MRPDSSPRVAPQPRSRPGASQATGARAATPVRNSPAGRRCTSASTRLHGEPTGPALLLPRYLAPIYLSSPQCAELEHGEPHLLAASLQAISSKRKSATSPQR